MAAELGGVVMLAWIALSLREDTNGGSWPQPEFTSIANTKFWKCARACVCEMLELGGRFEMDWLLIAILIAAVGAHLLVAGFGR
jgi:hypothetical protein